MYNECDSLTSKHKITLLKSIGQNPEMLDLWSYLTQLKIKLSSFHKAMQKFGKT